MFRFELGFYTKKTTIGHTGCIFRELARVRLANHGCNRYCSIIAELEKCAAAFDPRPCRTRSNSTPAPHSQPELSYSQPRVPIDNCHKETPTKQTCICTACNVCESHWLVYSVVAASSSDGSVAHMGHRKTTAHPFLAIMRTNSFLQIVQMWGKSELTLSRVAIFKKQEPYMNLLMIMILQWHWYWWSQWC